MRSVEPEVLPLFANERSTARLLGVTVHALRRWRREGRGPRWIRIEKCIRYPLAELERIAHVESVTVLARRD